MDLKENRQNPVLRTYIKLMRTTADINQRLHKHLAGHKLTISQFGVLETLLHLGPMCQKEIGSKLLKTGGNITLVIDNLEKRNLVIRKKNPEDRRFFQIHLTKNGEELIRRIFPHHIRVAEEIFSVLDKKQLDMLADMLVKLARIPDKKKEIDHD